MKPYFYSADEYLKETFGKKIFRLSSLVSRLFIIFVAEKKS